MECRKFEVNLLSATNLENVREMFQMKVYAVASIAGNKQTETKTPVDKDNETNPAWNYTVKYTVGEAAVQQEGVMLVVKLYCSRTLGDRYVGEVHVSIKELYEKATANGNGGVSLSYQVRRGSVPSQGELKLSCSFGERVVIEQPSMWKKLLGVGAMVLLRVTVNVALGVDIDIPFFY